MPSPARGSETRLDRARGCLVGLAVGDALGATVEFLDPVEIREQFGVHKELCGEGWLRLQPGEVTDETGQAKVFGESLLKKGRFDPEDLGHRLVGWLEGKPRDVGVPEREGIERISAGVPPLEAGVSGEAGAGNGAAVRGVPAGIRFYNDRKSLRAVCFAQASLTHLQEEAQWGSYLAASLVGWFLERYTLSEVLRLAKAEFKASPGSVFEPLERPLNLVKPSGYIGHTLHAVLYDLFREETFEATVVAVVNRGGDSDAAGALAGALAGACYGFSRIPERWKDSVQWSAELSRLGEGLLKAADSDRRKR